jgi:hypothetical protein
MCFNKTIPESGSLAWDFFLPYKSATSPGLEKASSRFHTTKVQNLFPP